MTEYSPAWPHTPIESIFPDIFFVTGTNKTTFNGKELQHSRNMIVIRENGNLSLINSVRLTSDGLKQLESLGTIKHVIRLGAFHGRDDAFYKDQYQAELWTLEGMQAKQDCEIDHVMPEGESLPFSTGKLIYFQTAKFPEAVIHLKNHHGILITCDSIKNWVKADDYFSPESAKTYKKQGFFGQASISDIWLQATGTNKSDFDRILKLPFHHLLSAHGEPLLDNAKNLISETVKKVYSDS